jgi:hypothetical protein
MESSSVIFIHLSDLPEAVTKNATIAPLGISARQLMESRTL